MKRILFLTFCTAFCVLSCAWVRAEALLPVCINEICSGNGGHYTVKGSAPDYIELRNLTNQALSLDGFFISDDEDHPEKFSLAGYSIPENGYILLAADKKELPFKLSSSGEELFLSDNEGNLLQHVTLPPLEKDETYSLQDDGAWQITDPTPLAANGEGAPYVETVYVASPRFSHSAGFYDDPFDLTIESYKTYRVYYTTDGSVPDENATLYTGPIHIADATSSPNTLSMRTDITINGAASPVVRLKKSTVIRAVAIDENGNRSNVMTGTFFVGFQNYADYHDISILSIVADPFDLFDEDTGIYVLGKMYRDWLESDEYSSELRAYDRPRNYGQGGRKWEIPASIQYFDRDENLRLTQNVGLRIHGNMTRENAQKAMNLYARKEYGESTFQYSMIDGVKSMSRVVVRAQAGRDSIAHGLLEETGLAISRCTPCLVFLNGEFWGFYELREKQEDNYFSNLYNINKDALMIYKNYGLIAGADEKGRTYSIVYKNFVADIIAHDPATEEGYTYACEVMDMDNYITYMAAVLYCNNEDMFSNKTLWRTMTVGSSPYEDGRWRWIIQDMDGSIHRTDGVVEAIEIASRDELFEALLKNPVFRRQFLIRIMDFANVELTPEYVEGYITPILNYYNQYFALNDQRWSGVENGSQQISAQRIDNIMSFFKKRKDNVIERIQTILGLTEQIAQLSVAQIPLGLQLTVNGRAAHLYGDSWEGSYYIGGEVSFSVEEIPGYRFLGWYEGDKLITEERDMVISVDTSHALTPMFEELSVVIFMNETEHFTNTGKNEFTKRLSGSMEKCSIRPDAAVKTEETFIDRFIKLYLDASVKEPQGFTLTLPLRNYLSAGVWFTVSVPEDSAPLTWSIRYKNSENAYQELPVDSMESSGGILRLSAAIPKEQLDNQLIDIRLEAEAENGSGSFVLRGFRIYGVPMEPALARAYEYARMAVAIGAEARYLPDLDEMLQGWSAARIEAETVSLRAQLQTMMTQKALSTVGSLDASRSAWEGLEAYPAVVVDENLIQAFYNQETIGFPLSVSPTVYLYEASDDTLRFQGAESTEGGLLSLKKRSGVFFVLDRPVEGIRFRTAFDTAQISDALLSSALSNMTPQRYLWMDVETLTQYQEEASFELPQDWAGDEAFVYRLQNEELEYVSRKAADDDAPRFVPANGRYLLLDDSLESYAEQANWEELIAVELQRNRALEDQRYAVADKLLKIMCAALAAVLVAASTAVIVLHRKKK